MSFSSRWEFRFWILRFICDLKFIYWNLFVIWFLFFGIYLSFICDLKFAFWNLFVIWDLIFVI